MWLAGLNYGFVLKDIMSLDKSDANDTPSMSVTWLCPT